MRTALLQSSGRPGSVVENLKVLDEAAGRAAAAGAGLLVAPEMFLTGYAIGDDIAPARRARRRRLAPTRSPRSPGGTASRSPTATRSAPARRSSTPRSSSPPTASGSRTTARPTSSAASSATTSRRATQPVVQAELDGLRVGILICYDVEFPENVRAHALAGTDLLAGADGADAPVPVRRRVDDPGARLREPDVRRVRQPGRPRKGSSSSSGSPRWPDPTGSPAPAPDAARNSSSPTSTPPSSPPPARRTRI